MTCPREPRPNVDRPTPTPTGLFWPTVLMLLVLGMLVGLGTWQLERKAWKEDLIAKIRARARQEPAPVEAVAAQQASGEAIEYTRVRARGQLLSERSLLYYAPGPAGAGYHVYTPLLIAPSRALLVNRGYIPEAERAAALAPGNGTPVEVVGLARMPGSTGWFTPKNDPARNLWFSRNLNEMAAASLGHGITVLPFFVDEAERAGPQARKPGEPAGGATRLELPNRHLEYAVTWYGLASSLIAVYSVFAWGRWWRSRGHGPTDGARRRSWGNP